MIALQRWVEAGIAPERFVATKYVQDDPSKGVQMTRPVAGKHLLGDRHIVYRQTVAPSGPL